MAKYIALLQAAKSQPSIPVMRSQPDLMREGPTSLKQEALAPHPVQTIQANVRGVVVCFGIELFSGPSLSSYACNLHICGAFDRFL